MKNIKLLLVLISALFTFSTAKSQLFVGGSFDLSSTSSKSELGGTSVDGPALTSISFIPKVGFFLNDNFAVGTGIGVSFSTENDREDSETVRSEFAFHFNPFARYYFMHVDKFSMFGEGGVDLAFGSSKVKTGGTTTDGPKTTDITIYVAPAIAYNLTDQFILEGGLGALYFGTSSSKQDVGNDTNKDKASGFGLSIDLDNLFFGMIYKF